MIERKPETHGESEDITLEATDNKVEAVAEQAEVEESTSAGKKSPWRWLFVLILFISGTAGWFFVPHEIRHEYLQKIFSGDLPPVIVESEETEDIAVETAYEKPASIVPEAKMQVDIESAAPATDIINKIDAESLEHLSAVIQALNKDMNKLQRTTIELRKSLEIRQALDLKSRLRWISSPDTSLMQIQLAWEDIGLLPSLSDHEHQLAMQMRDLAAHHLQRLKSWLTTLEGLAGKYETPNYEAVEISKDNSWLAWLKKILRLYRAPSLDERHMQELRVRILKTRDQLSRQQWPEKQEWHALLADIIRETGNENSLDLPESLGDIEQNISKMRSTASDWLNSL
ncbi:MAG: hypothetical protein ACE5DY_06125 [Mariprofundaceae bacterium]